MFIYKQNVIMIYTYVSRIHLRPINSIHDTVMTFKNLVELHCLIHLTLSTDRFLLKLTLKIFFLRK